MEQYQNWLEEKRSAYLYHVMTTYEKNVLHQKLFSDLEKAAEKQATLWEEKIYQYDPHATLSFIPDKRTYIVAWLIKHLGGQTIYPILSAMKIRGMSVFNRYHSEHRHTRLSSANNLRAAIFGVNDGLISNMSLILGIASAGTSPSFILLAGTAGLLAGACSMGAGEYISVRSQREVFEYQIAIEKQELEEYPEEEKEELSLIYQARGITKEDADHLAALMINNPETGLDTLAREELGLNPKDLVSPIGAALYSFFSFALGAGIPLLPFIVKASPWNLIVSIGITAITLFVVGMLLSLFTNKNAFLSGCRMLIIGAIAGSLTFIIGKGFSS